MNRTAYQEFLARKAQSDDYSGFAPLWLPKFLFEFQAFLTDWSLRKGKSAVFADCGLGKTLIELVWAENVVRKTNRCGLIATPLAVSHQTLREGDKFGIECRRSTNGRPAAKITVTNYERLHLFDPNDYAFFVGDESSILKNFDGVTRAAVTEFLRKLPYRLLCTATAAPNDYIELGTTSEALGELGYTDMLTRFFKNDAGFARIGGDAPKWRFKKHAEESFWRWVCSWARALRKPSDLGFDDGEFILPPLDERLTIVETKGRSRGELFARPAIGLQEQRQERRATIRERCEKAAELLDHNEPAVAWCELNDEGDLLEELIPGAVQVKGSDRDEAKEERFIAFADGEIRALVTKPRIGGFGMNWQHCAHMTSFPSHSWEQYYQTVRRFLRFGQKRAVVVDTIASPGERDVLKNRQRKAEAAERMFAALVAHMNDVLHLDRSNPFTMSEEVPAWL